MISLALIAVLAPLVGALAAGLYGRALGRTGAHTATIAGVGIAFVASLGLFKSLVVDGGAPVDVVLYAWGVSGDVTFPIGFLLDELTVTMMVVVTFVSWMVHFYTIGYMHDDPGYQRFFSYISLFTFSMLMLVMSNNLLQLFFGWEAVGLVSYLLIGFWFKKDTAIYANLKAFLVNRVGDFGFLLGIAAIVSATGSVMYHDVFAAAGDLVGRSLVFGPFTWDFLTATCILLFIGAMGKSAQVPLHVWLPDSMEGPTPISALIHAATMVTAGIFMVARMSPVFELSEAALSFVLVIGATTAFFMGLLGLVQNDIKRVIAYSTLSQLGYMTAALGASAYSAAIFHLVTHAFFKALLFLAAGSVIIGMHHVQDMRQMGGLRRLMPITYWTSLIGSLALIGFPGTAGFYSKDVIIEAVAHADRAGAGYAAFCVTAGVFVTALYSFRLVFLVFFGQGRMDEHTRSHVHESPKVVTVPLVLLAVPSVVAGAVLAGPMLFGHYFGESIHVAHGHDPLHEISHHWHGALEFALHGFTTLPFFLAMAGVAVAAALYLVYQDLPAVIARRAGLLYRTLEHKYWFDDFNDTVFAGGARLTGRVLSRAGDGFLIDGLLVNGSAQVVRVAASLGRRLQTGMLYHYAFVMIVGLLALLAYFVHGWIG